MTSTASSLPAYQRLIVNAEHVVPGEELAARLAQGNPLRIKLGLDPTARSVTLGWAVVLRKLRQFQDEGHTAILIVGDFTARVGDPSAKSQTRPQLTREQVRDYASHCLPMFMDVLSKDNLEVRYNSEWLEDMDLSDVLELTANYTVAQMLERDDFSKRYDEKRPISIIEFMYPLLQAYDSVAVRSDVELGGTDQLFNLLVGRDLQRAYGQDPQIAMTTPLLVGLDGVQKMSQSLGNFVGIRDEPQDMFGKLMSIPDRLTEQYASLAAWLDEAQISEISEAARAGGPTAGEAKRRVARHVVALYHGAEAADASERSFDRTFKQHRAPAEIAEAGIPPDAVDGDRVYLPRVLAELGLASSRSEARRLISQGGVKVNGDTVTLEDVPLDELAGHVLQVGKRKYVRLS